MSSPKTVMQLNIYSHKHSRQASPGQGQGDWCRYRWPWPAQAQRGPPDSLEYRWELLNTQGLQTHHVKKAGGAQHVKRPALSCWQPNLGV